MKVGYARKSTGEQKIDRQITALKEAHVDKIFTESLSGKNTNRPELKKMMEYVREGDTVIVTSISRFARNTRDLLNLVEQLRVKKVEFVSLKETIDTTTPSGRFILAVFGAISEMERDYILDRQKEGIAEARKNGTKFGRPTIEIDDNFVKYYHLWKTGDITATKAIEQSGFKRGTFYRLAKEMERRKT